MHNFKKMTVRLLGIPACLVAGTAGAGLIDLTDPTPNTCADLNDGAYVCNYTGSAGSVGSGVFPSFVASPGGQDPQFYMYNTTGDWTDDNSVGNGMGDNETLQLFQMGVEDGYVVFGLDINQVNSGEPERLLTVDAISLYGSDGSLIDYNQNDASPELGGSAALWSLAAGDFIKLNYDLAFGSGNDIDMYLFLPVTIFAGLDLDTYLQLFSRFGGPADGGFPNNDGFEEWNYLRCPEGESCWTDVPEPGSLALLAAGLIGVGLSRRKRLGK